ncbi:MAG: hypothetical protein QW491_01650 [Thermoproteota archaeon]|nr:hypothetical protein [Candidatus Brockarchaeota archaeon]
MGEYHLFVCYKWKKEEERSEAEKELRDISYHPVLIPDERLGIDAFYVLWQKGLRHMATILATAYDLKFSKREGIREVYEQLRRKVKAWIRSEYPWGHGDYIVPRVFWPCEILDLKEVQDEIKVLASGEIFLCRENQEDRRIMWQAVKRIAKRDMPTEEIDKKINDNLGIINAFMKDVGTFLTKTTGFHHKYPKMRFWFYVEFD